MSPREELEAAFEELFRIMRDDVVTQAFRDLREYSVRGDVSNLFRGGRWRDFVVTKIKPILERYLSRNKADAALATVYDAAGRYDQKLTDLAALHISTVDTIQQLADILIKSPVLNREQLWADVEGHAFEQARELSATKKKFKVWVTAEDERVRQQERADHVMMHNVTIPVSHKFKLKSGLADHPGSHNLAPEDRIRCRCKLIYTDER